MKNPSLCICIVIKSQDKRIYGVGTARITVDGEERVGYIMTLAVEKELRNIGLGKRMLEMLVQELRQSRVNRIELDVMAANVSAIKLYLKCGFHVTRAMPKYYKILEGLEGERQEKEHDAFHMELRL